MREEGKEGGREGGPRVGRASARPEARRSATKAVEVHRRGETGRSATSYELRNESDSP